MKFVLITTTAMAALSVSPALAAGGPTSTQTTVFTVNGSTPAKCKINADNTSVSLTDDLTDDQGRVNANVASKVVAGLNALGVKAWCTGGANSVVLSRSTLNNGDGSAQDGFNRAIAYDLEMDIADAKRAGGASLNEGTSDGPGNGPGAGAGAGQAVSHFGPTGAGSAVAFRQEPGTTVAAVTNGSATETPRSTYTESDARLVAGNYTGTVTMTITPGL
jgi:hypothetical protein